jgi:drug/metabolite transporter (DMT)-like permease
VAVTFVAEPVVSALLAWLILQQQPSLATVVGGGIILAGIFLVAKG